MPGRRVIALWALGFGLAACAEVGVDRAADTCGEACDVALRDPHIIGAPEVLDCNLAPEALVCVLDTATGQALPIRSAALTIHRGRGNAPSGALLSSSNPVLHLPLDRPEDSIRISARLSVDAEHATAIGAAQLADLRAEITITPDTSPAVMELPIELWELDLLGTTSSANVVFEVPASLSATGAATMTTPLSIIDGQRRRLAVVAAPGVPSMVWSTTAEPSGTLASGVASGPGIYTVDEAGLSAADPDSLPRAPAGTPAIDCRHREHSVRCAVSPSALGRIGKTTLVIERADGRRFYAYLTPRFATEFELAASDYPAHIFATVSVDSQVFGLPPESRELTLESVLDAGIDASLSLPFELWELKVQSEVDQATVELGPYTLELGMTTDDWYRYAVEDGEVSVGLSDTFVPFYLAAPPGLTSLPGRLKLVVDEQTTQTDDVNIGPGQWIINSAGLHQAI